MADAPDLRKQFIHLGPGATSVTQPPFDGMEWYGGYEQRHGSDGAEGRLVSMYRFDAPWDVWEMHPSGTEVVVCVSGSMDLIQQGSDGEHIRTALAPGQYAINPPGVWHTADISGSAEAMFITAGEGTQHRPR
ncbi:cupin [Altererythrobacter aquiaggeris]|uniref:cupin domain-containing protein n=1 Tax=Aestuarierythrobacter aquiaggeris TaxID=1898396 RepID=UPI0030190ED0